MTSSLARLQCSVVLVLTQSEVIPTSSQFPYIHSESSDVSRICCTNCLFSPSRRVRLLSGSITLLSSRWNPEQLFGATIIRHAFHVAVPYNALEPEHPMRPSPEVHFHWLEPSRVFFYLSPKFQSYR